MREMRETLRATFRRVLRLENRRREVRPGRLEHMHAFHSEILGDEREVVVYLPAGYDDHPEQTYPLLIIHDGQNVFEAERAFVPGQYWQLKEAADQTIGTRTSSPFVIAAIDHGSEKRIDEYTPVRDEDRGAGGKAADHARMLVEELIPAIAGKYRVRTDRDHVAIAGSSLGGLVSLFLALRHSDRFGRAIVMSPSIWWANRAILKEIDTIDALPKLRLWLDVGQREGAETLADARALASKLRARGWTDENFTFLEDRRGDHSEAAWARRIRAALEFLFPPV
jgi:predicted alpha/beta superfamily hydrolase